ncbi:MAG: tetratricopeptide repeat protein, partial [Phycisphaerales bacterium]
RALGTEHSETLTSISNVGAVLRAQGKLEQAEPYYREALEQRRRVLGEEHSQTLYSVSMLVRLELDQHKPQEALDLLMAYEPAARKSLTGRNAPQLAPFLTSFARARAGVGYDAERFSLAEANLLEAHPLYLAAKDRGPTHKDTIECVQALVDLYTAWHAAEPGKGYDAKAAEWKAKLPAETAPKP